LTPAFLNLAEGRGTSDPILVNIWLARTINSQLGGAFVAPWEIGELSGEWIDALTGMAMSVPGMAQGKQKVESALEKWRKSTGYKQ
jgi:hypothetical protein